MHLGHTYSPSSETIKEEIISPYISVEKDEARISVRIKDSLKDLRRNDLINKINSELHTKLGIEKNEYNHFLKTTSSPNYA